MRIAVVVTPKAGQDKVVGYKLDGAGNKELAVKVAAVPEGGKATKAVCELLAKQIGVPKASVRCVRGGASRHKQIEVDCEQAVVEAWLANFDL